MGQSFGFSYAKTIRDIRAIRGRPKIMKSDNKSSLWARKGSSGNTCKTLASLSATVKAFAKHPDQAAARHIHFSAPSARRAVPSHGPLAPIHDRAVAVKSLSGAVPPSDGAAQSSDGRGSTVNPRRSTIFRRSPAIGRRRPSDSATPISGVWGARTHARAGSPCPERSRRSVLSFANFACRRLLRRVASKPLDREPRGKPK